MEQNEFYEVNGCNWFIPVDLIEEDKCTKELEVVTTESGRITFVPNIYKFRKPHEPKKPVIPEFVAEWLEECKRSNWHLKKALFWLHSDEKVYCWAYDKNGYLIPEMDEIFARAWLDGYEIEKEELYTVEIPNPNNEYSMNALIRLPSSGKIALVALHKPNTSYLKNKEYQLTESEIKQDFEWAWQWAKEVGSKCK